MPTWFERLAAGHRKDLPCLIIGEVAQAHDGSLGMAHAFIDAIATTGADAVKFQTHIAAAESTSREPWRIPFSPQDPTRYDYWRRMEFTEDQWRGLSTHAAERGLAFLSSPFSVEAFELLQRVGVPAWKIASGEMMGDSGILDCAVRSRRPVLVSTGLSPLSEIDRGVRRLQASGLPFAVLQCTTAYPCPPDRIGLNLIPEFAQRYQSVVGLSDHSGTIFPSLAAVTLGAQVLELHVTLSREMFGPDVSSSVTTGELRQIVEGARFITAMRAHPVDKNEAATQMQPLRDTFGKSIVARTNLAAGTVLGTEHFAFKKAGRGLPPGAAVILVGRQLRRNIAADEPLSPNDIEASPS